ncbi:MAG: DUF1780 domain-containing protein [Pseudomonadota bacterium]
MNSEEERLNQIRNIRNEEAYFFSNKGTEVREKWIVSEFLTRLGVLYKSTELISGEPASKIDISFRDASFQIKEIPDQDIERTKEARQLKEYADKADSIKASFPPLKAKDIPLITDGYELALNKSQSLSENGQYPDHIRKSLDLLIYITRRRSSIIKRDRINEDDFKGMGWRSISVLMGDKSNILYCHETSPEFLREKCNKKIQPMPKACG